MKHDCIVPYSLNYCGKKILYVQLHSFNELVLVSRAIPSYIKATFQNTQCTLCGTTSDIIPDHKDGLYQKKALKVKDFQPLCIHCNFVKRERYKKYNSLKNNSEISIETIPFLKPLVEMLEEDITELCFWKDPTDCMRVICEKILKMKNKL